MADFLYEYYIIILFVALATVLVAPIGGLMLRLTTSWVTGFRPTYSRSVLVALGIYVAALVLGGVFVTGAYYVGFLLYEWLDWPRDGIMIGVNVAILAVIVALVVLWARIIEQFIPLADGATMGMRRALRVNLIHLVATSVAAAAIVFASVAVMILLGIEP
ncbi:hypothetical protein [Pararhodobacter sp.]|uniref:hypothetical protein n=1 Tax=Pararhodobacter sp. TaxID=2127056 RepID=UPI002AFE902A|nr:hypothetical protein [Pararhodobacter sp.]